MTTYDDDFKEHRRDDLGRHLQNFQDNLEIHKAQAEWSRDVLNALNEIVKLLSSIAKTIEDNGKK